MVAVHSYWLYNLYLNDFSPLLECESRLALCKIMIAVVYFWTFNYSHLAYNLLTACCDFPFRPINKLYHLLDSLQQMDSHYRYPINYYPVMRVYHVFHRVACAFSILSGGYVPCNHSSCTWRTSFHLYYISMYSS